MRVVRSISELPHPRDNTVGLVPTMGALHEGHLDLMREARQRHDIVVVSLFVNPTQFGKNEDFDRYPRDFERDRLLAQEVGVDVLFAPSVAEVYPGVTSTIHVPEVTERWEGAFRPGHFDGVATIVAKLFNMVRPDAAYFGQKDLQQCAVIRRLVVDLNMPVSVEVVQTRREPDGLAMSSRNVFLSAQERAIAPALYREIALLRSELQTKDRAGTETEALLATSRQTLTQLGFLLDYLDWVSSDTFEPVRDSSKPSAVIVAARLGKTRLIDNVVF